MCLLKGRFFETAKSCYWVVLEIKPGGVSYQKNTIISSVRLKAKKV